MHRLVSRLVIYRNIGEDSILMKMAGICRDFENGNYIKEEITGRILDQIHALLDLATQYGFDTDLWKCYIAWLLAMTENPFTLVSEKKGAGEGTVNEFAANDFAIFCRLLHYDFSDLEKTLNLNCFSVIRSYHSVRKKEQFYNKNVSIRITQLCEALSEITSPEMMGSVVMDFYKNFGVGLFGMNKAFRLNTKGGSCEIVPIIATSSATFDDLVGYDVQKSELMYNTQCFLDGKPANNVLLYGDAGTGKSTSIKALINKYYENGLRVIEVYKHDFKYLPELISIIKSRNYRFIIYMDDLSFESAETEYKYLKAVIEGDLEERPDNVLIYATSNRRHLVRETFSDRSEITEDDVHRNDTMAERLSLAARFGVCIGYFKPDKKEYLDIVRELASKIPGLDMPEDELFARAERWAIKSGERSGRAARNFVNYIAAKGI